MNTIASSSYSMLHRPHAERAFYSQPVSLLEAALVANESAVAQALKAGANVNECDAHGRTVVGCAIGGERWDEVDVSDASFVLQKRLRILKMLLDHDEVSLHALNAPQRAIRGVTPLGFAAWLNIPSAVRMLLENCPGLVSVDGMDSLGATALMYAARDGNVQVVQHLLMNGARADFRDIHHRTSIQHSLRHPEVLWLCESSLKRQRAQRNLTRGNEKNLVELRTQLDEVLATIPLAVCHPRLMSKPSGQEIYDTTHALVSAITIANIQHLYTLLFSSIPSASVSPSLPPVLVNHPDPRGWSPIHYCVSVPDPSRAILDLLYRAGADVSLYTSSGHGTPLHCLARAARPATPATIRSFVRHLVDDLRAPLAAVDQNKETCIHIAAEHGESEEVLAALLSCDTVGTVRELRNSRGLTALEVAKPIFRVAFGLAVEPPPRCSSALSVRTIKPSTTSMRSDSSLASLVAEKLRRQRAIQRSGSSDTSVDLSTMSRRILDNFRQITLQLAGDADFVDPTDVVELLQDSSGMSEELLAHMQARVADATEELESAREKFKQLDLLVDDVTRLVEITYGERLEEIERDWDLPDSVRRRTTDSSDSGSTAVSIDSVSGPSDRSPDAVKFAGISGIHTLTSRGPHSAPQSGTSSPRFLDVPHMELGYRSNPTIASPPEEKGNSKSSSPFPGGLSPKKGRGALRAAKSVEDFKAHHIAAEVDKKDLSMARLKAWFKRKLTSDSHEESLLSPNPARAFKRETRISLIARARPSSFIFSPAHTEQPAPLAGLPVEKQSPTASDDRVRKNRQLALAAARRIISTSSKDLVRIAECMNTADHFISLANRSVSQAQRIIARSLAQRETSLDRIRLMQQMSDLHYSLQDVVTAATEDSLLSQDQPDFLPVTIPSSPRDSQLIFPRPPMLSTKSSMSSLTSTLIDGDDEDTRALRRLLTRKIEERTNSALDEIEKVSHWLRVVKDVMLGLRKRTQL